jgi:hypothetical protein
MNTALLEELLNEDESTSLDFKREQYPFRGATDEQKSELLKDILAFANSFRRTDAYILIGVEDVKGARKKVVGITEHMDDADLQQFVNSKLQRPLNFSYETVSLEGRQIGVIRILLQERPYYLKKNYGKLESNIVYIRRGSSTDIAGIDEIAKMGMSPIIDKEVPKLHLEFANKGDRTGLGDKITFVSEIIDYDESKIPVGGFPDSVLATNINYKRDLARYIKQTSLFKQICFKITNTSPILASNVHLVININKEPNLFVLTEAQYPEKPTKEGILTAHTRIRLPRISNYSVKAVADRWVVNVAFGSLQPKAEYFPVGAFYIGSFKPCELYLEGALFGDNIPEPIKVSLKIEILVKRRNLLLEELQS